MSHGQTFNWNWILYSINRCWSLSQREALSSTSENPDDKNILPLTPSHIMLGRTLDTLPNSLHEDKKKQKSVVDSWKERMKISNKFWNAWKKEYLANIRKFSKQNDMEENLKVNDLVLVLTEKNKQIWLANW